MCEPNQSESFSILKNNQQWTQRIEVQGEGRDPTEHAENRNASPERNATVNLHHSISSIDSISPIALMSPIYLIISVDTIKIDQQVRR